MRVVGVVEFGGTEKLQVFDVPPPEPGPLEVRIRVHAASVNPTDIVFRRGEGQAKLLGARKPPFVPGMDAAGVIDRVGSDLKGRFDVGERVIALVLPAGPHGGAYAEQIVVPAASVVRAPERVALPVASTLLLNGLTARLALDALGLTAGQTIAITGAAGAVGGLAIQLAHADGLRVIADAAPADEALVRSLGADIIVPRGDVVGNRIREVVATGVPGLIDTAAQNERVLPAIADGGGLAVLRGWNGPTERGIVLHKIVSPNAATDTRKLERLRDQVDAGTLTLRVLAILPASRAADAHRWMEAGGVRGRLVLDFAEDATRASG